MCRPANVNEDSGAQWGFNGCGEFWGRGEVGGTVIMMTFDRISRSEVLRAPPK